VFEKIMSGLILAKYKLCQDLRLGHPSVNVQTVESDRDGRVSRLDIRPLSEFAIMLLCFATTAGWQDHTRTRTGIQACGRCISFLRKALPPIITLLFHLT